MTSDLERVRLALARLKVFPLPNAVLLPRSIMPLRVFEPRYRQLAADCIQGDRVMAVALLKPGWRDDYDGRPPVYECAGVGVVAQHERLPDGRYHILLRGVARVRIDAEHAPTEPYRVVRARLLDEDGGPDPELAEEQIEELRRAVFQLLAARPDAAGPGGAAGQVLASLAARVAVPGVLADAVAGVLIDAPEERQRVLEMLSVAERVKLVAARVAELAAGALAEKRTGGYRN